MDDHGSFGSAVPEIRTGQIDEKARSDSLIGFHRLMADTLEIRLVSSAAFEQAARFADKFDLALRSGDALHLALSVESESTLVTLDKRLAAATKKLGFSCEMP